MIKKLENIDFVRGLAVFLVIIHHSSIPLQHTLTTILAFHMPFFFILNGFLVHLNQSYKRYSFFQFVKKKFVQLMIPNYLFCFFSLGVDVFINKLNGIHVSLYKPVLAILFPGYNLSLDIPMPLTLSFWFLPCMFITSIASFSILKLLHKIIISKKFLMTSIFFVTILFFVVNYKLSHTPYLFTTYYFQWNIATQATAWVLTGYLLTPFIKSILDSKIKTGVICIMFVCLFLLDWSVRTNPAPFLMYINSYGNFTYALIGALSGSVAFFILSSDLWNFLNLKYRKLSEIVAWFGKCSLAIFPIHIIILQLSQYFGLNIFNQWGILVLMLIGSYIITKFLSRSRFGKILMGQ